MRNLIDPGSVTESGSGRGKNHGSGFRSLRRGDCFCAQHSVTVQTRRKTAYRLGTAPEQSGFKGGVRVELSRSMTIRAFFSSGYVRSLNRFMLFHRKTTPNRSAFPLGQFALAGVLLFLPLPGLQRFRVSSCPSQKIHLHSKPRHPRPLNLPRRVLRLSLSPSH